MLPDQLTAAQWIEKLQLRPHPEGGYFREMYRSEESLYSGALPARYGRSRNFSTAIYYLLEEGDFSAFHRIESDEIWHFYAGDPLRIPLIYADGRFEEHSIGCDPETGHFPLCVIPRNNWFGAGVFPGGKYALLGCTVSPGFDFDDLELADRKELLKTYPQHRRWIEEFTRS